MAVHSYPPTNQITVSNNHTGHRGRQTRHGKMAGVDDIGHHLAHYRFQISKAILQIGFSLLHPLKPEGGGTVIKTMEIVHPRNLMREGDFTEADERNRCATRDEASDEFPGIGPHAGDGV